MNTNKETIANEKKHFLGRNKVMLGAFVLLGLIVIGQFCYITHMHRAVHANSKAQPSLVHNIFGRDYSVDDWDPFTEMQRMQRDINRMFHNSLLHGGQSFGAGDASSFAMFFEPDFDIQEKNDVYIVNVDLPGMDKDKIDIHIEDTYMTIEGERAYEKEDTSKDNRYFRSERSFGTFSRVIPLPGEVEKQGITADYKNGVLKIKLPKLTKGMHDKKGTKIAIE